MLLPLLWGFCCCAAAVVKALLGAGSREAVPYAGTGLEGPLTSVKPLVQVSAAQYQCCASRYTTVLTHTAMDRAACSSHCAAARLASCSAQVAVAWATLPSM